MGRLKRRKLINIQNLNGGSDGSSSKRQKTTGNTDSESSLEDMGKENVLPNDIMEELVKKGIV